MINFKLVQPAELHDTWTLVLPGVERVREKISATYWAEDVFAALRSRTAQLYLGYEDDAYVGFLVVVPEVDNFSGKRILTVWLAYSARNGAFPEGLTFIENLARGGDFHVVRFHSIRPAWAKIAPRAGFHATNVTYEKAVTA